jgi:hypothetical protein
VLSAIDALARDIDRSWARAGHGRDAFCEIAVAALHRPLELDLPTVARSVCAGAVLPQQRAGAELFGQPTITLHHDERYVIEAVCWHTGSADIHQHPFAGAFRLLTGTSVHSRYSFVETERPDARLSFGALHLEDLELLDDQVVVPIPYGPSLIHSAFHLDNPTMTVVVRTHDDVGPSYRYLPPGVAFDPGARSPDLDKRLELLDTLSRSNTGLYTECVHTAIASGDLHDGMAVMMRAGDHDLDGPTYLAFLERLVSKHGRTIEPLVLALLEDRRRRALTRLRDTVTDRSDRHFIACLLSFSGRDYLLDAMARYHGDDATARRHIAAGVATVLRVPRETRVMIDVAVAAMIEDVPPRAFPRWTAHQWGRALTASEGELLAELYTQLLEHPLLVSLRPDRPHGVPVLGGSLR